MTNPSTDITSAFPAIRGLGGTFTIPMRLTDETIGGSIWVNYLPIPSTAAATKKARAVVSKVADRSLASSAQALIGSIEATLTRWSALGLDQAGVPELQAFSPDDGSILLEWGSPRYRVGFSMERNEAESAWYLVSTPELGEIGASGYIAREHKDKLVPWLLNFIATNT